MDEFVSHVRKLTNYQLIYYQEFLDFERMREKRETFEKLLQKEQEEI